MKKEKMEKKKMESPTVELFAIGTELVMGRVQDTNTFWMAKQLADLGATVKRCTVLSDDMDDIVDSLTSAISRKTRFIITSGGLGPTPDDMTTEAMARVFNTKLAVDDSTVDDFVIRRDLKSRDEVSEGLLKMATVPVGSTAYPNPNGWAPCIRYDSNGTTFFATAGPPKEMEGVFTAHVAPAIAEVSETIRTAVRVAVSMHESEVSPHMIAVMEEFPSVYIKAYVAMRVESPFHLPVDLVVTETDTETATITLEMALNRFTDLVTSAGKEISRIA